MLHVVLKTSSQNSGVASEARRYKGVAVFFITVQRDYCYARYFMVFE
jgi:hypothetical protein